MTDGKLFYHKKDGMHIFKMVGDFRFNNSSQLSYGVTLLTEEKSFTDLVVDMRDTTYVDSTVLGIIGQIAKVGVQQKVKPLILFKDLDLKRTLDTVGFAPFFDICKDDILRDMPKDFSEIQGEQDSPEALKNRVLKAHQLLCEMNEDNIKEFGGVIAGLKSDMKNFGDHK